MSELPPTTPEAEPAEIPRIWIGCLAAYNDGMLHGDWVNAAQEPEAIMQATREILSTSPIDGAEEWAIFDHDGFLGLHIGEHESFETVSAVAVGIVSEGAPFAAWLGICDEDEDPTLERFRDAYRGHWESAGEYAASIVEECTDVEELLRTGLPPALRPYIYMDFDAIGLDMERNSEIAVVPSDSGGVWIYDTYT